MTGQINIQRLYELKRSKEKICSLTVYDATFARLLAECGVEVLLVGDSLGMVLQGADNTLRVTMDDMVYHTRLVASGAGGSFILADMPFMSYPTPERALENAARLLSQGGAHMIKLEGGGWLLDTVRQLAERGIPVCAHLGLTPQWVHKFGGYRVQGREPAAAAAMVADAQALEQAGAELLVLECVPSELARRITASVSMPVIGIGAGPGCDGQVLVLYDVIGVSVRKPRMARNFLQQGGSIQAAVAAYVDAVKSGKFPEAAHSSDH